MDKTLVCQDCGKEFIFTEGEQAFYKEKGFDNEPKRCVECRRARKANNNNRNYCLIKEGYNDYSLQPFYLQIKICNYNLF